MVLAAHRFELREEMKTSPVYLLLAAAEKICFIGDSLTEGTINGGVPWYEPLMPSIQGTVFNFSEGGATSKYLLARFLPAILRTEADLYVVAAGANDILFRDPMFCAMTAKDYIKNLGALRRSISEHRSDAKFIFIAPWPATDGDAGIIGGMKPPGTEAAYEEYTGALRSWCGETGDLFIDPRDYLSRIFDEQSPETYLLDFIHPNAHTGVRLYAEAVLMAGRNGPHPPFPPA